MKRKEKKEPKKRQKKSKFVRNLTNLWREDDEKITKIANQRGVPKAQVIREVVKVGLRANLKDLK